MKLKTVVLATLELCAAAAFAQTQNPPPPSIVPVPRAGVTGERPEIEAPEGRTMIPPSRPDADTSGVIDTPASSANTGTAESSETEAFTIAPAGPVAVLTPKTVNGVTYLCGGVGKDEAALMKRNAAAHDLMLTFATRKGAYLADVNVEIDDARGNPVLHTTCDGPIMLVDLPRSGNYRIRSSAEGMEQRRVAYVNTNARSASQLVFSWPGNLIEAAGSTGGSAAAGAAGSGAADKATGKPEKHHPMHEHQGDHDQDAKPKSY